ncbi:hypothetical protein ACH4TG_29060, partial [Streptomyces sp. NPDC020917]
GDRTGPAARTSGTGAHPAGGAPPGADPPGPPPDGSATGPIRGPAGDAAGDAAGDTAAGPAPAQGAKSPRPPRRKAGVEYRPV